MLDSSPTFRFIELDEVASTNSFLADYRPLEPTEMTLVTAEYQTAGRGQAGNSWESAPGQNLLFSLLLHPTFLPPTFLFLLSEAIALAIRDTLASILGNPKNRHAALPLSDLTIPSANLSSSVTVKWPNDIYVDDRKIAGILIENQLSGQHIGRCIIGCGININQTEFHSDAPNPVSLRQLLGYDLTRTLVLDAIITAFRRHYSALRTTFSSPEPVDDKAANGCRSVISKSLHASYLDALYRRTGLHPYLDATSPTPFLAEVADVEPSGHLILRDTEGHLRRYAFKEVAFILPEKA